MSCSRIGCDNGSIGKIELDIGTVKACSVCASIAKIADSNKTEWELA